MWVTLTHRVKKECNVLDEVERFRGSYTKNWWEKNILYHKKRFVFYYGDNWSYGDLESGGSA